MDYLKEVDAKIAHDPLWTSDFEKKAGHLCGSIRPTLKRVWVPGPVIVGAGPSGLAVAACLKQLGIPRLILERASCIASLWQLNTYDRLRLHLPKHFCQLPYFPFPSSFPTYPTKQHFITYLEAYVKYFSLKPVFESTVVSAEFDHRLGLWRVKAEVGRGEETTEYVCRWVVVAAGENAEVVVPEIEGLEEFEGRVMHTSCYKCGEEFKGKRVLVVGCGNSGMEVSLDLFNHGACPSLVVRDSVHVLPQEMLGTSTFGLSKQLLKWLPVFLVDRILLFISRMTIGDTDRYGLHRPAIGPLQLKRALGKTPVLDMGTIAEIRAGNIKVFPSVIRIFQHGAKFLDGRIENFDAIIFATGYKSNVPSWLKGSDMFSKEDGFPIESLPQGWKGKNGLYAAGFTKGGILALSLDATRIASDIDNIWTSSRKEYTRRSHTTMCHSPDDHKRLVL